MDNPFETLIQQQKEIIAQNKEIISRLQEKQPKPTDPVKVIDVAFQCNVSERTILRWCDALNIKVSNDDPYDGRYNTIQFQDVAKLKGYKSRRAS